MIGFVSSVLGIEGEGKHLEAFSRGEAVKGRLGCREHLQNTMAAPPAMALAFYCRKDKET